MQIYAILTFFAMLMTASLAAVNANSGTAAALFQQNQQMLRLRQQATARAAAQRKQIQAINTAANSIKTAQSKANIQAQQILNNAAKVLADKAASEKALFDQSVGSSSLRGSPTAVPTPFI